MAFGHYGANRTPTIPAGWSLAAESYTPGETVVTWTNGFVQQADERRQTVAHRIVSETGQFETTESWDTSVGVSVGVMVTFRGT